MILFILIVSANINICVFCSDVFNKKKRHTCVYKKAIVGEVISIGNKFVYNAI